MTRVLLIGATGFIGINLLDALQTNGAHVVGTRRKASITVFARKRKPEWVNAELEDRASLLEAMSGCETVYFAAGYYPRFSTDEKHAVAAGLIQAKNVVTAFEKSGARRLVYTSSTSLVRRKPDSSANTEADIGQMTSVESVYAATKLAMQREFDRARENGANIVSLFPSGCIGPWDVRVGTGSLIVGPLSGIMPWWMDGHINLVDVRDVASAHVAAGDPSVVAGNYLLGGHGIQLGDFLRRLIKTYGGTMPNQELSYLEAKARADHEEAEAEATKQRVPVPREFVDILHSAGPIDSSLAESVLGLKPRDLWASVQDSYDWFVRYRYLTAPTTGSGAKPPQSNEPQRENHV